MINVIIMSFASITYNTGCYGEYEFGADRDRVSVECTETWTEGSNPKFVPKGDVTVKIDGVVTKGCKLKLLQVVNGESNIFIFCH